jgi:nicotinamide riboside transporter PnuC
MLSPQAYFVVLFVVCAYAFVRGRTDERAVAATCVAASIASVLVATQKASAYSHHEAGILLVDIGAFVAFTLVALKSERFWPLWVAGLQLTTLMSHAFKVGRLDLMPQAYAAAARFWVYPIFLIIVIGTWRSHRRRMEERRQPAST